MTSVHFCFRRINPALRIDLLSVGTIGEGQFIPLDDQQSASLHRFLDDCGLGEFIHKDNLSSEQYVFHDDVTSFIHAFSPDRLDWFQDALVVVLTINLDSHESSEKKE